MSIVTHANRDTAWTTGLSELGYADLVVSFADQRLQEGARDLLHFVAKYVVNQGANLKTGETISYGYWLLRVDAEVDRLRLSCLVADGSKFLPAVDLAICYWQDQRRICDDAGSEFDPPRCDHMAAISPGVFEGEDLRAVRYHAPTHMSGWYLIGDSYGGGTEGLLVEHLFHLTARRPDLARYLALRPGFRFDTASGDVRFDEVAARG